MTTHRDYGSRMVGDWYDNTRHGDEIYGRPPLVLPDGRECDCLICGVTRWRHIYCGTCKNLGSTSDPCYGCGRGCFWREWGTMTSDPSLGA